MRKAILPGCLLLMQARIASTADQTTGRNAVVDAIWIRCIFQKQVLLEARWFR